MKAQKRPEVDLKLHYRKSLELAVIFSLLLHFGLFYGFPKIDMSAREVSGVDVQIEIQDIPPTDQPKRVPRPALPSVPIPTASEDVPEDVTIESTELSLDLSDIPPPPAPSEEKSIEEEYVFVAYDEPPYPIGGFAAIKEKLHYPEIARKAGIEGTVIVGVLIDEHGNPIKTQIMRSSGMVLGFEEAASAAVMSVRWKPAMQRDHPVKVWVSIPVRFSLRDTEPVS